MTFFRRQILAENVALARAKAAAKERKERKGETAEAVRE